MENIKIAFFDRVERVAKASSMDIAVQAALSEKDVIAAEEALSRARQELYDLQNTKAVLEAGFVKRHQEQGSPKTIQESEKATSVCFASRPS